LQHLGRDKQSVRNTDIGDYLSALKASRKYGVQIVSHRTLDPCPAIHENSPPGLHEQIIQALHRLGISGLYSHQAEAVELIRKGNDVVVATPTASGKSLIYNIPTLQQFFEDSESRALYLFPLKALAQDSRERCHSYTLMPVAGQRIALTSVPSMMGIQNHISAAG